MSDSTDYQYDVFLSYKRHDLTAEWTRRFQELFKLWLGQELRRPAEMFFDVGTLDTGDRWPTAVQDCLKVSRTMVGIWSPFIFSVKLVRF